MNGELKETSGGGMPSEIPQDMSEESEVEGREAEGNHPSGTEYPQQPAPLVPLTPPVLSIPPVHIESEGSLPKGEVEGPKEEVEEKLTRGGPSDGHVLSEPKGYRVTLDIFEGPLDLLLFLIRRDEIDIYDIPITQITDQYMEYLDIMRMLDLDIASDFLVMAATLIYIKSRMLLPPEERGEEEEEEYDPRADLVRQLLEYKKFKEAASELQKMELEQEKLFPRSVQEDLPKGEAPALDASIFDLLSALSVVLKRSEAGQLREIVEDRFTVSDRITYILDTLREAVGLTFDSLFRGMASRTEIVVTFLALLELMRMKKIRVRQVQAFGPIEITAQAA